MRLNVLLLSNQVRGIDGTGGLGDVAVGLAKALLSRGDVNIRLAMPGYIDITENQKLRNRFNRTRLLRGLEGLPVPFGSASERVEVFEIQVPECHPAVICYLFRCPPVFDAREPETDYSAKVVYRHEQTLAKPKADRLDLLRATRAHFGQLFMVYEDSGEVDSLLGVARQAPPAIEVTDEYGVLHRVWQVSDSGLIDSVRSRMQDKKLIIADGHHRYETAITYRNERRSQSGAASTSAPYEYAMMTFLNMNSPGLLILPTHRVVHGLSSFSPGTFLASSRNLFEVQELDPALDAARATAILREHSSSGTALLAVLADRALLLKSVKSAGSQLLAGLSERQRALDVVQLHKCLLEGVLELSEESIRNQQNISYVRDAAEAVAQVRGGKANLAFLMNPCRIQQVRDVAFAGEVMPQKSTDFYPKLLSGLTVSALE